MLNKPESEPFNFIVLPFPGSWWTWERRGFFNRPAHIIRELQKRPLVGNILIVDPPRPIWKGILQRLRGKGNPTISGDIVCSFHTGTLKRVGNKIYVLETWRPLPFANSSLLWHLNQWVTKPIRVSLVRRALDLLNMPFSILWLGHPLDATFIDAFGENMVIFDAVDNLLEHPRWSFLRKEIELGYNRLAQEADLVFTVSEALAHFFESLSRRTALHIPNGVDFGFFQTQATSPEELKDISKPIIGYVGTMTKRIDLDILYHLTKNHRDWSFVFIGPLQVPPELFNQSNVYFLGKKHYRLIPSYVQAFDVCIMPHISDAFAYSMNPIKVYEYLACGKPVVSTPVPPCTDVRFAKVIYVAGDRFEFDQAAQTALLENTPTLVEKRLRVAKQQSWASRVDKMLEHILTVRK